MATDDADDLRQAARRIGHDLGNVVGVITNYCAVLGMTVTEEPAAKYLAEVKAAAERAAELTREVLQLGVRPDADLPAATAPRAEAGRPAAVVVGTAVLVADDDAMNQRLARLMLERAGYLVDVVGNGSEAVEAVARGDYAAVLMDCEMAVMDGYAATAEIRRREGSGPRIPIIAVTANALDGDEDRVLAAGMDAHITKPYDIDRLEATLASLIAASRQPPGG